MEEGCIGRQSAQRTGVLGVEEEEKY